MINPSSKFKSIIANKHCKKEKKKKTRMQIQFQQVENTNTSTEIEENNLIP